MMPPVFTSLNPARSGMADYAEALLAHEAGRFDPTVFIAGHEPSALGRRTADLVRHEARGLFGNAGRPEPLPSVL